MAKVNIIGSGPAGISAALYAARAGLDVTVFTIGKGALEKAEKIQNYYGFGRDVSGAELAAAGIEGAKNVGVRFVEEEVVGIGFSDTFTLETAGGSHAADYIVIATGAARRAPAIRGLRGFEGKGVSYCAVCDAFFYRGKRVAVLGAGEYALHEVQALLSVAASVTLLTNGEELAAQMPETVPIVTEKVELLEGKDALEEIVLAGGSRIAADGLFVAQGVAGSTDLAAKIGAAVENGKIVVDENMQTTVPGIYAAGDCTGGLLQISKAVYEGAKAGTDIAKRAAKKR